MEGVAANADAHNRRYFARVKFPFQNCLFDPPIDTLKTGVFASRMSLFNSQNIAVHFWRTPSRVTGAKAQENNFPLFLIGTEAAGLPLTLRSIVSSPASTPTTRTAPPP
jgi:hypothetical protein